MDSTELLHILREEARKISNEDICLARAAILDSVQNLPEKYRKAYSSDYFAYLYRAFQELRTCAPSDETEPVDMNEYTDLLARMNLQNNGCNVKKRAFHRFAVVVIPYIAFIAKKNYTSGGHDLSRRACGSFP
ncbi:MAG: hypothetical protein PWQ52_1420 [Methanolobus sp.]|nr:hypothetical protein [Methanolobus sp.]